MKIAFLGNFQVSYSSETHHAASLEALGHEVIRLQEPKARASEIGAAAVDSDMFVWVHTHGWNTPGISEVIEQARYHGVPIVAYHLDLYMGIKRWEQYEQDPYMRMVDHFFTVDRLMADWLNENTSVKGHFLPAGVYGQECYISDQPSPHGNDVVFVGSRNYHKEWAWRGKLIQWLRDTYGKRFTHVGGDGDTGTLRGDELNRMYANSKVAVGDTLCIGFDYPYYASDRLFECPGRGGFNLFPRIKGIEQWFTEGEEIAFYEYGDFDQLKFLIDYYLEDDGRREQIRRAGHERAKANHTYVHRWQEILNTVFA